MLGYRTWLSPFTDTDLVTLNRTSFDYLDMADISTGNFQVISYRQWNISQKSEIILVSEIILEKYSTIKKVWPGLTYLEDQEQGQPAPGFDPLGEVTQHDTKLSTLHPI